MGILYYFNEGREAEIKSCFQCEVEFHYRQDQVALSDLIEEFKNRGSKNS